MEFTTFVRKPFTVSAVEVTEENIAEIAELIGDLREKNGKPYIAVDRRVVPNVFSVYIGYWFTKIGDNKYRCYVKRVFKQQFVETNDEIESWIEYLQEDHSQEVGTDDLIPLVEGDTEEDAIPVDA